MKIQFRNSYRHPHDPKILKYKNCAYILLPLPCCNFHKPSPNKFQLKVFVFAAIKEVRTSFIRSSLFLSGNNNIPNVRNKRSAPKALITFFVLLLHYACLSFRSVFCVRCVSFSPSSFLNHLKQPPLHLVPTFPTIKFISLDC